MYFSAWNLQLCFFMKKGPVKEKSWHTVVITVIEVQLFLSKLTFMEMFIVWLNNKLL